MIHEKLTHEIIGAAMTVLNELKPGLDEKLYENALILELAGRGHAAEQQKEYPVFYRTHLIGKLVPYPTVALPPPELERLPLVLNQRPLGWISDHIAGVAEGKTPTWWWIAFIPAVMILGVGTMCVTYLISTGVGVWGLMIPVAWAWDIT